MKAPFCWFLSQLVWLVVLLGAVVELPAQRGVSGAPVALVPSAVEGEETGRDSDPPVPITRMQGLTRVLQQPGVDGFPPSERLFVVFGRYSFSRSVDQTEWFAEVTDEGVVVRNRVLANFEILFSGFSAGRYQPEENEWQNLFDKLFESGDLVEVVGPEDRFPVMAAEVVVARHRLMGYGSWRFSYLQEIMGRPKVLYRVWVGFFDNSAEGLDTVLVTLRFREPIRDSEVERMVRWVEGFSFNEQPIVR